MRLFKNTKKFPIIDFLDLCPDFEITLKYWSFVKGANFCPLDIALVKYLAKGKRCLDIGTLCGTSAANMAEVGKECITIDLPLEDITNRSKEYIDKGQAYFSKNILNIKHIYHDSTRFDFSQLGKFDLIFIDGHHTQKSVQRDTENAFKVLNDDGIIIWHDYLLTKNLFSINQDVFWGIIKGTPSDKLDNIYGVSDTICAIYIKKKFPIKKEYPPEIPNKEFIMNIKAKKL